jgi:hypothetical protein
MYAHQQNHTHILTYHLFGGSGKREIYVLIHLSGNPDWVFASGGQRRWELAVLFWEALTAENKKWEGKKLVWGKYCTLLLHCRLPPLYVTECVIGKQET